MSMNMKHASDTRKPYSGLSRSLVIAIDVGTTFSGVSYAILEPGEIPKIHGVTRFPGQEHVAGNSKIPSLIYYDKQGKMVSAGAEADSGSLHAQAEDEGWIKAELFKLRLRPRTMQLNMNGMRLGALPKRKSAVHVFGDFLAYLYRCTRTFISDTHANGAQLWNAVEQDIQFVLSHPNGWEGAQQTKMRRAAVYGGLIPDTNEGKARIRFVTEGEASLHACVLNGLAADVLSNPSKHGFLIADAGGGTLDISGYAIRGTSPLVMEEIAPPDCIFAGSVFVSRRAREFLEEKLKNSKYGTPEALDHITRRFDETTKRLFRDRRDLQFIPFGSPLDKDLSVGIRAGQLKLTGNEVANLFEPSVDAAFNAIKAQIEASHGLIKSVFLVGGYAASPWLFTQLQERLAPMRVTVSRPDTQTSKAVADGAIGFYCDHHVSARMSKFMYGVEFLRELNPSDPDHVARRERLCELPSGPKLLPDAFDCILARGLKVKESTVFTRKYCTELTSLSMLSVFEVEIWCYRGGNKIPKWINRHADDFSTLCVVRADLSLLSGSAEPKSGRNGKTYWTIVFSVEIHFGLTEFRARIKWNDNGTTRYGPASIVYNERGHRAEEDEPDIYPEDDIISTPASASSRERDRTRSAPISRARSPSDTYYPAPAPSERRVDTSFIPEVARIERTASKNSSSSPTNPSRGAVGGYGSSYNSDSDRRRTLDKGKERERDSRASSGDRPRGSISGSGGGRIGDTLGAVWDTGGTDGGTSPVPAGSPAGNTAGVHSRSPSIKDPALTSLYSTGGPGAGLSSRSPSIRDPVSSALFGGSGVPSRSPSVRDPVSSSLFGTSAIPSRSPSNKDPVTSSPFGTGAVPSRSPSNKDHVSSSLYGTGAVPSRSPSNNDPVSSSLYGTGAVHSRSPSNNDPVSSSLYGTGAVHSRSPSNNDPVSSSLHGTGVVPSRSPSVRDPVSSSLFDAPAEQPVVAADRSPWGEGLGLDKPRSAVGESPAPWDAPRSAVGDAPAAPWDASNTVLADTGFGLSGDSGFGVSGDSGFGLSGNNSFGRSPKHEEPPKSASVNVPVSTWDTTAPSPADGKGKKKGSKTSGLASRNSPAVGTSNSPFGKVVDQGFEDIIAAPAATSSSPVQGLGLFGSKSASPNKALSPLNPASQAQTPAVEKVDLWGLSNTVDPQPVGNTIHWGTTPAAETPAPEIVAAETTVVDPAPVSKTPIVPSAEVAEEPEGSTPVTPGESKKKKKKGGVAAAAAEARKEKEEKEKKEREEKKEKEREEKEKKEREEAARKEEENREWEEQERQYEQEKKVQEEHERKEREEQERIAQEEHERKEHEKKEKEEKEKKDKEEKEKKEKEKKSSAFLPNLDTGSTSLFDNTGRTGTGGTGTGWGDAGTGDAGEGGDADEGGWGSSWGAPTTKKGKKTPPATTPKTTTPASTGWGATAPKSSSFSFGGGGGGWGGVPAATPASPNAPAATTLPETDDISNLLASSPNVPAFNDFLDPISSGGDAAGGSSSPHPPTAELTAVSLEDPKPVSHVPSRAGSPVPPTPGGDAADVTSPTGEEDADGEAETPAVEDGEEKKEEEEDGGGTTAKGKKKKKGKGGANAAADDAPGEASAAAPGGGAGKGKKKKKK